jgi:hypothetical protein
MAEVELFLSFTVQFLHLLPQRHEHIMLNREWLRISYILSPMTSRVSAVSPCDWQVFRAVVMLDDISAARLPLS